MEDRSYAIKRQSNHWTVAHDDGGERVVKRFALLRNATSYIEHRERDLLGARRCLEAGIEIASEELGEGGPLFGDRDRKWRLTRDGEPLTEWVHESEIGYRELNDVLAEPESVPVDGRDLEGFRRLQRN
jgi:hypothetical protein